LLYYLWITLTKRQQDRTEVCNPNEPSDKTNKSTSKLSPIKSKVKQTKETEISRNTGRRKLLHNLNYIIYHLGQILNFNYRNKYFKE
ncbi:hypothetical protein RhiirA4_547785, partial [Rhizophagus irregularis]